LTIERLDCSSLVAHECITFCLFELVNSRLFCVAFKFSRAEKQRHIRYGGTDIRRQSDVSAVGANDSLHHACFAIEIKVNFAVWLPDNGNRPDRGT